MTKGRVKKAQSLVRRFRGYAPEAVTFRDPEDVHQMRVAGRTLLAYIDFAADRKSRKDAPVRGARKSVKGYMRLLGELRDLDVLIDELRLRMSTCDPSRLALLARWIHDSEKERAAVREHAATVLTGAGSKKFARIMESWEEWLAQDARAGVPKKNVRKLRGDAEDALEAIAKLDSYPIGDEAFLNQVHMARIEVKKLRYALATLDAGDHEGEIEKLKAIQDRLGRAQDLRVWMSRLEKYRKQFQGPAEDMTIGLREEMLAAIEAGVGLYLAGKKPAET